MGVATGDDHQSFCATPVMTVQTPPDDPNRIRNPDPAPDVWPERSRELSNLLARSGLGDRAAFARLYERSSGHLFAVVLRIQRDRGQAEDLLQEIYVSIWKAAASFDASRSQPLTWLTHIARNRAIDSLRRAQTQPQMDAGRVADNDENRPDPLDLVADAAPGPMQLLGLASERRDLQRCIEGLSPQQRQSVALAFFDGLSHAEVAAHLREPLGTVKSWVRRALNSLKACLDRAALRDSARVA